MSPRYKAEKKPTLVERIKRENLQEDIIAANKIALNYKWYRKNEATLACVELIYDDKKIRAAYPDVITDRNDPTLRAILQEETKKVILYLCEFRKDITIKQLYLKGNPAEKSFHSSL